jgi:hypothetical protein
MNVARVRRVSVGVAVVVAAVSASLVVGAAAARKPTRHGGKRQGGSAAAGPAAPSAGAAANGGYDESVAARFAALRDENRDLTYAGLTARLAIKRRPENKPSFDPTAAAYWKQVHGALQLTPEEQATYRRLGMVGVDHMQHYSMAKAYLEIYRRDLPVLITTDSILNALHRSFDDMLVEIETQHFAPAISRALERAHGALRSQTPGLAGALHGSAQDVDLYLTVARNLLAEPADPAAEMRCAALPDGERCEQDTTSAGTSMSGLRVPSVYANDGKVREVLAAVAAQRASKRPLLYGRRDVVTDWSQFAPRGHYTRSAALKRYFRTMMWLGRAELGFSLSPSHAAFGERDPERELRDAAMLAHLLRGSGAGDALDKLDRAIGFMVGTVDSVTPRDMAAALDRASVSDLEQLGDASRLAAIRPALVSAGASVVQRIRSETGHRPPGDGTDTAMPEVMQVFGQRFVLDSFLMSKLVYDSISFQGHAEERTMPSGLDVAAAFGNDEAVALLAPELEKWHYAANLLAARRIVEQRPPAQWTATLYDIWMSALATLDDVPSGSAWPEVMRGRAWHRKQLQTQLASWAELRHDTILYAKQSYTMGIACEYPTGYVEPYPAFYARLAAFAELAQQRLGDLGICPARASPFLTEFAGTLRKLERMAQKELAGTPFSPDEQQWLKQAITAKRHGGGCGGPRFSYDGWYPKLVYDGRPDTWEPTIADVHTDPNTGEVLEVGTGDVKFVVVAIDSGRDRAAYVGPVYSYYELTAKRRLTDEAWRQKLLAAPLPRRPEWIGEFQPPAKARQELPWR